LNVKTRETAKRWNGKRVQQISLSTCFNSSNLKTSQWFKKKTAKWFNNRRYSKTLKLFETKNTQIGEAVRMLQLDSLVKSSSTR